MTTTTYEMPPDILSKVMDQGEADYQAGRCITTEELEDEMKTW